jgi:uncharacterized protein
LNHDATLTPTEPVPPTQPSALRKIFVGKDGLRAGWSLLIFIALFAAMAFCINFIGHRLYPTAPKTAQAVSDAMATPRFLFIGESMQFLLVLLVRSFSSPGSCLGSSAAPTPSTASATAVSSRTSLPAWLGEPPVSRSSVLILWKTGLLVIDSRLLFGSNILRYGAVWLIGFLLLGLFEEYTTRGYLQYTLTRGLAGLYQWAFKTRHSAALGFWTAAIIFSILFGLSHNSNPGESPIGLLSAGLAGLVFCFSLWRTGSLWWAIGFHTSWDWAQSFLYGVADSGLMVQHRLLATHPVGKPILSGGATGPEGSIFIVAIMALVSLIILFTLPRSCYGDVPEDST